MVLLLRLGRSGRDSCCSPWAQSHFTLSTVGRQPLCEALQPLETCREGTVNSSNAWFAGFGGFIFPTLQLRLAAGSSGHTRSAQTARGEGHQKQLRSAKVNPSHIWKQIALWQLSSPALTLAAGRGHAAAGCRVDFVDACLRLP